MYHVKHKLMRHVLSRGRGVEGGAIWRGHGGLGLGVKGPRERGMQFWGMQGFGRVGVGVVGGSSTHQVEPGPASREGIVLQGRGSEVCVHHMARLLVQMAHPASKLAGVGQRG